MPLKTSFLQLQSSDLFSTVWGGFTCRPTSGAGCTFTTYTPPPPPPLAPMLLNCSKQAITSNQPGFWEQGEGGVMEDWSWRRVTNIIMLHGSIGLIQKDMCLTVNTTNAATHNTAFCKSSVNASTLHSCSYFKQG